MEELIAQLDSFTSLQTKMDTSNVGNIASPEKLHDFTIWTLQYFDNLSEPASPAVNKTGCAIGQILAQIGQIFPCGNKKAKGFWDCGACNTTNKPDSIQCKACNTAKIRDVKHVFSGESYHLTRKSI